MHPPFSLRRRSAYPWWFGALATAALVGFFLIPNQLQSAQLLLSVIGGIAAFFHFLYSQHNSNTDRFIKLFQEFNARFDKLNDQLNRIYLSSTILISDEKDLQTLYDYFNLCSEEYLYFKSGYIDQEVWKSWLRRVSVLQIGVHRSRGLEIMVGRHALLRSKFRGTQSLAA
jgi:hypothetical protein